MHDNSDIFIKLNNSGLPDLRTKTRLFDIKNSPEWSNKIEESAQLFNLGWFKLNIEENELIYDQVNKVYSYEQDVADYFSIPLSKAITVVLNLNISHKYINLFNALLICGNLDKIASFNLAYESYNDGNISNGYLLKTDSVFNDQTISLTKAMIEKCLKDLLTHGGYL